MTPFNRIVCSATTVQTAFADYHPLRLWWSVILALHGKPSTPDYKPAARLAILAAGFQFYAAIYGLVGILLVLTGPALLFAEQTLYAASGISFVGLLLLTVTLSGYRASQDFANQKPDSSLTLILFMVFLMLFLTGTPCAASLVVNGMGLLPPLINLFGTASVLLIGVGSYLIEIIFLVESFHLSSVRVETTI
jgi:hypothetical protein